MSDGFSTPNPADTTDDGPFDGDPPDDDPDDYLAYDDATGGVVAAGDVSCENCAHKPVCAIFEGFAPMMADYAEGGDPADAPVDPTELAVICDEYVPQDDE